MEKRWELPGKRVRMTLNKHEIVVIRPSPQKTLSLKEGEERLKKILDEAR